MPKRKFSKKKRNPRKKRKVSRRKVGKGFRKAPAKRRLHKRLYDGAANDVKNALGIGAAMLTAHFSAPSYTKTSKTKNAQGSGESGMGGKFADSFTWGRLLKGGLLDQKLVFSQSSTERLSGLVGKQVVSPTLHSVWDNRQITSLNSMPSTTVALGQRVVYTNYHASIEMLNADNVPMTIWFYLARPRWELKLASGLPCNAAVDWDTFQAADLTGGNANLTSTMPHATPFKSKGWCERYEVKKVFRKFLEPGQTWEITLDININKTMSAERVAQALDYGHLTWKWFPLVLGGIGNDSTTKTQISYMPCSMDMTINERYEGYCPPVDNTIFNDTSSIPTAFTIGGVTETANVFVAAAEVAT